ncbi:MAG: hypothetical protein EB059_08510 [Alphaproteobacteria bacterium]|nr:hypothetical protein [Alphaproteobacteria bacterium]
MPTHNPRVNITFEPQWQKMIAGLAKAEGKSISSVAKDLIIEALELREDFSLSQIATAREETFKKSGKKLLSHEAVWKKR